MLFGPPDSVCLSCRGEMLELQRRDVHYDLAKVEEVLSF
jgi:hypothetical protein